MTDQKQNYIVVTHKQDIKHVVGTIPKQKEANKETPVVSEYTKHPYHTIRITRKRVVRLRLVDD